MEEFSSNESGWTKYLGSSSKQEEGYSSVVDDGYYNYYSGGVKHKKNEDEDDDDSITSDATSGPRSSRVFRARGINAGGCSSKYSEDDEDEELYCGKKCKEVKSKSGKVLAIVSKAKGALKQKRGVLKCGREGVTT